MWSLKLRLLLFVNSYVASGDQTPILRTGYWASYNIPFYEYVYNVSGYPELVKKYGPEYSYQLAPRAKIFRRDEAKVCALWLCVYDMCVTMNMARWLT